MGSSKEICQFYGGFYGKILISCGFKWKGKFHGISENGWISLVPWNLWQPWKNAQFLSWNKFLLWSAELLFSVYICSSDIYYAFRTSSSSCGLFLWIFYSSWWMHSALILRSEIEIEIEISVIEIHDCLQRRFCVRVCRRAWKIRDTKYSPGDFIFYDNTSLFCAI